MLHNLVSIAVLLVAVFWGVLWLVYVPWLGIAWLIAWFVALTLDYQLYSETAPATPVVEAEFVSDSGDKTTKSLSS